MAIFSPTRLNMPILVGLKLIHRGKVRDTYQLPNGFLLILATDAISIFDFTLDAEVRDKGWVLNVMSYFFLTFLEANGFKTHLIAAGRDIDRHLPKHLRNDPWLQCRAMVVRALRMYPIELVHRTHFLKTSKSFENYDFERGGDICGHLLPAGLQDGDALPYLMDTPTTKSESGDMPVHYEIVRKEYPAAAEMTKDSFVLVSQLLRRRGILIPDTKKEAGEDDEGNVYIGDEVFSPDCSRFWMLDEWEANQLLPVHVAPTSADKQIVRAEGRKLGIHKLDPNNPEHHAIVHKLRFPGGTFERTREVYFDIAEKAMGNTVRYISEHKLGIKLAA
jgi:phosphoribosylaminoimidazole-succinocarboxamide synthase